MEKKTTLEQESELGLRLQRILSSQASWDSIERALGRLASGQPNARFIVHEEGIVARVALSTIPSVDEAISVLENQGGFLAVQIEVQPALWKVVSLDGQFEDVFTPEQMTEFARLQSLGVGGAA